MNRLDFFKARIPAYRKDVALFAKEQFGFNSDDWQKAVFADVVTDNRVSVKSGQGVGKTAATAIIGDTVIITAPEVNGKFFVKWESSDITLAEATKSETSFIMPAKDVTLTAVYDDFELAIEKPSNTTVFYKNNIDIKATVGELPEGATVEWTANNDCFKLNAGDKGKCVGTAQKRGTSVFTAKIKLNDGTYATDSEGNTLSSSIEVTVKYAWWQWIIVILLFGWIWY